MGQGKGKAVVQVDTSLPDYYGTDEWKVTELPRALNGHRQIALIDVAYPGNNALAISGGGSTTASRPSCGIVRRTTRNSSGS
jgi:hypothetical protein